MAIAKILQSSRLILTAASKSDILPLHQLIFSDKDVIKYTTKKPFTLEESKEFINRHFNFNSQFGFSPIFLKDSKKLIGYGGIMPFRDGYEFGYIIAKKYWKQGYGLEIAKAQLDFIQNRLKAKAYATSHPKNIASIKILEKLGLKLISVEKLNRGLRNIYTLNP